MKRFFVLLLVFFLFSAPSVRATAINEVHPAGDEWIELYNGGNVSQNLTGWKIGDSGKNESLDGLELEPGSFGLLIDKNDLNCSQFNLSGQKCKESEGNAIGYYGLKNSGENLTLYSPEKKVDRMDWTESSSETSVGRVPDGESWNYSLPPTPGKENYAEREDVENETQTKDDEEKTRKSSIKIKDFPEAVKFGSTSDLNLEIFRNGTAKYAVYARVERIDDGWDVSEESKMHVKDKNQSYSLVIPVKIKENCNRRYSKGEYQLKVEGLGTEASKIVALEGWKESTCQEDGEEETEEETKSKTEITGEDSESEENRFELFNHPERVTVDEKMQSLLLIRNENGRENYTVYSYIYKKNTPVTEGGWFGNKKVINMGESEKRIVRMENRIKNGTKPGNYSFKVRVKNEEDLVRNVEIAASNKTANKTVNSSPEEDSKGVEEVNKTAELDRKETQNKSYGRRVFEKKTIWEKVLNFFNFF